MTIKWNPETQKYDVVDTNGKVTASYTVTQIQSASETSPLGHATYTDGPLANASDGEYIGLDGKSYDINFGLFDGYRVNNWAGAAGGREDDVRDAIEYFLTTGRVPGANDLSRNLTPRQWDNVKADFETWMSLNNLNENSFAEYINNPVDVPGMEEGADPRNLAFNAYWNSLYGGESGKDMLGNLEGAYARQANADMAVADVQYQQGALQQAQVVKSIADQVRAERMARLRSGMSESQIANQDMQMMMANVNALNQNAQLLGVNRTQAQLNTGLAKDQAYMDWLNQSNARGQVGAAMSAADAGNPHQMALQYSRMTGTPYPDSYQYVVNPENKK